MRTNQDLKVLMTPISPLTATAPLGDRDPVQPAHRDPVVEHAEPTVTKRRPQRPTITNPRTATQSAIREEEARRREKRGW